MSSFAWGTAIQVVRVVLLQKQAYEAQPTGVDSNPICCRATTWLSLALTLVPVRRAQPPNCVTPLLLPSWFGQVCLHLESCHRSGVDQDLCRMAAVHSPAGVCGSPRTGPERGHRPSGASFDVARNHFGTVLLRCGSSRRRHQRFRCK